MTTRSRFFLMIALAPALLSLPRPSAGAELTKEQVQWFMSQPENKKIFDSPLSAEEKLDRISHIPANHEKFGPDVEAQFLALMAKHSDTALATEADNADHAADPGKDNKAIMANGNKRRATRTTGGKALQAERRPQKRTAGVKTQKEEDAAEETTTPAAEASVDASAGQSMGGAGIGVGRESKMVSSNKPTGGGSGGGGGAPASAAPKSGTTPSSPTPNTSNDILSVVCGATKNVLTWKLVANRNSNSVIRNVGGADGVWVCGGPASIAPCTNLDVNTFTDTDVQAGQTYSYRVKSAPACTSNTVTCPGGKSSGDGCSAGGAPGTGGSGGSGGGTGGTVDWECTGGNPKCICVKNVGKYNRYSDAGRSAASSAFPGQGSKPAGMSDAEATAKICAAYLANPTLGGGTACRSQGDEVVFEDPAGVPDGKYPTVSVDVITSAGAFWGKPIAACEPGVQ